MISLCKAYKPFIFPPGSERYLEFIDIKSHCYPVIFAHLLCRSSKCPTCLWFQVNPSHIRCSASVSASLITSLLSYLISLQNNKSLIEELTNIFLVSFCLDKNQTLTQLFVFCLPGKFGSCYITSYRLQGGCSRLEAYKTISWFSIILDFLVQEICKVFFSLQSCKQPTFCYRNTEVTSR